MGMKTAYHSAFGADLLAAAQHDAAPTPPFEDHAFDMTFGADLSAVVLDAACQRIGQGGAAAPRKPPFEAGHEPDQHAEARPRAFLLRPRHGLGGILHEMNLDLVVFKQLVDDVVSASVHYADQVTALATLLE